MHTSTGGGHTEEQKDGRTESRKLCPPAFFEKVGDKKSNSLSLFGNIYADSTSNFKLILSSGFYYENLPMQYTEIFSAVKLEKIIKKKMIFFLFLLKT